MASSLLLRPLRCCLHLQIRRGPATRTYLTDAFHCRREWDSRLDSPIFQRLRMSQFFFDIERKFQREKRGSAIDIDIFANAANGETELEQLEELLHQFRRTPQTWQTLPSTFHASVRAFVADGRTDNLMRMIDDRLNYGIFPDNYSLTYLLDHFLKLENWRDAAKVAVHMMLQEEVAVPIASEMGILGAYQYALLGSPEEPWEPQATPQEPEPEDDVKVKVDYLDTGHFDDHFDLVERNHLVGKTLVKLCQARKDYASSPTDRSLVLLGWTMYEKWDKVQEMVDGGKQQQAEVAEACATKIKELVSSAEVEKCPQKEALMASLDKVSAITVDVEAELKERVVVSVKEHEGKYREEQLKCFKEWNERRDREMEKQFELYQRESRKDAVSRKMKEMESEEEKLFFFERQEEFDRKKEEKELEWRKKLPPRTWKRITLKPKEVVAADYVPPQVGEVKRSK